MDKRYLFYVSNVSFFRALSRDEKYKRDNEHVYKINLRYFSFGDYILGIGIGIYV